MDQEVQKEFYVPDGQVLIGHSNKSWKENAIFSNVRVTSF